MTRLPLRTRTSGSKVILAVYRGQGDAASVEKFGRPSAHQFVDLSQGVCSGAKYTRWLGAQEMGCFAGATHTLENQPSQSSATIPHALR